MKHLMNGTFYWLMSGEGITIGQWDEWHSGFSLVGSNEFHPPDIFPIIEEVCLEHTVKFPAPGKNKE